MATLGQLANRYLRERTVGGSTRRLSPQSIRTIRQVLWPFVNQMGHTRRPNRVTRRQVQRWVQDQKVAPATLRNRISVIHGFFDWAVKEGYLRSDPTAGLAPVAQPRRVPRALPASKVARVLEAVPDARARLMVSLAVQEGLRVGEIAHLKSEDVDLEQGLLVVIGKGDRQRIVPLTTETRRQLSRYLAESPLPAHRSAGLPLVRSSTRPGAGLSAKYVSQKMSEWMHEAGVEDSAHSLRHTAATDILRNGSTLRDVQQILGHANLGTTQRYLAWVTPRDLRDAMEGRSYRNGNGNGNAPQSGGPGRPKPGREKARPRRTEGRLRR